MKWILALLCGYLVGSLNPAALIAKLKRQNLRRSGTGNLGATNVLLHFGKFLGLLVMLFDLFKAYGAVRITALLFPQTTLFPYLVGVAAVIGHIAPFYLRFQGGKGLAAFGGLVLAYHPWVFLGLLLSGCVLMLLVNYSFILPLYAGIAFPILVGCLSRDLLLTLLMAAVSALIVFKHVGNIQKAREGRDNPIRAYLKNSFFTRKQK